MIRRPPEAPSAAKVRPPRDRTTGHMFESGRFPAAIEFGFPGRGSNHIMALLVMMPVAGSISFEPNRASKVCVSATMFPVRSTTERCVVQAGTGRNPGTYVAVHYLKLIDFTFGGELYSVSASGQRGLVAASDSGTWDSVQLRVVYHYADGREAAFDIHTSWVTPDNFPGYVDQEVQFRFDNGVWNAHSRRRGVECTIEGKTPLAHKISLNNHYNGKFIEPDGRRTQRGYGIEVLERFFREVAYVEFGGPIAQRGQRMEEMCQFAYNDLSADRQVVAAVQALEAILARHAAGEPDCVVRVNAAQGGLVLYRPGHREPEVLYQPRV